MVGRAARGRNLGAGFELSELSMQPVAQVSAGMETFTAHRSVGGFTGICQKFALPLGRSPSWLHAANVPTHWQLICPS